MAVRADPETAEQINTDWSHFVGSLIGGIVVVLVVLSVLAVIFKW